MQNMYNLSIYKMSKDYDLLKELLDKGMTPIVLRHGEPWIMTKKGLSWEGETFYGFSAGDDITCQPGVGAENFSAGCTALEIEFVVPSQGLVTAQMREREFVCDEEEELDE